MFNKKCLILISVLTLVLSISVMGNAFFFSPTEKRDTNQRLSISSPNNKVKVNFEIDAGIPKYSISYNNVELVNPSSLGFKFKNKEALDGNFKVLDTSTRKFNNTWKTIWGEKNKIKNHYEELTIYLKEKQQPHRKMNLVFRVYNDGVGFRYVLPSQEKINGQVEISSEDTEFQFASNNTSWWIPNDWDSYEYNYRETSLSKVEEVSTPFTMKTPEGIYLTLHEAKLIDYSGMALKATDEENTLESHLAPWPNEVVKVKKDSLPIKTPWRTLQIGEDAGDLVESDMILNLNDPNALADTSWIEPMKYVGVWWEMISGKSTWESGDRHGATTENAKRYIDFAHNYLDTKNQNIGLLVEGWNMGWDGSWIDNGDKFSFTKSYPDYDLKEVVQYADEHDVSYIMHNETAGSITNYEKQMAEAYDLYQKLGIHAIKSGYVADDGMHSPKGQHHHGQYMVNHYLEAVKRAAEHQIMINTHEPIKSTGLYRTYPNWVAREGVSGMEYSAFDDDNNLPRHDTILPFTRMMAGPIDFTPGIFDVRISHSDNRVHSTRAKQLALYVTISSGIQMVADLPQNYKDKNGDILPGFKFIKDVPVNWDDIIVPHAKIGDYVSIVRRSGEKWYIGSITDEKARDLDIELDFLDKGEKYVAEIYTDGPETSFKNEPENVVIDKMIVEANDTLVASLAAGGGQAVRLYPATDEQVASLPEYKVPKFKVSYLNVPNSVKSNNKFDIKLNIANQGNLIATKELKLYVDGEVVATKEVRLAPKNEKEVTLSYSKLFNLTDHQIRVDDLSTKGVTVKKKETTLEYSDLDTSSKGNNITVKSTVTNFGSYTETVKVKLYVDGEVVKTKRIEVGAKPGGASKEVEINHKLSEVGVYEIAIGNSDSKLVTVPQIELSGKWLFHKGDNLNWKSPELDDSDWEVVNLPAMWESHSNYKKNNVYGWYRKKIHIPENWKGYSLKVTLGKIDDVDQTFFNGEKIGESGRLPFSAEKKNPLSNVTKKKGNKFKFTFNPAKWGIEKDIEEVHVVCGVNNWQITDKTYSLTEQSDGIWTGIFDIPQGTGFKFVYNNAQDWGVDTNQVVGTSIGSDAPELKVNSESKTKKAQNSSQGMKTAWTKVRNYVIPAEVINYGQTNVISVRVFDATGGGGIYKGPLSPIKLVK